MFSRPCQSLSIGKYFLIDIPIVNFLFESFWINLTIQFGHRVDNYGRCKISFTLMNLIIILILVYPSSKQL